MASLSLFCITLLVLSGLVSSQEEDYDFDPNRDFDQPPSRVEPVPRFVPERDEIASGCGSKVMDVFFILDSSTSIWVNDYRREQTFVKDVISRFDIGSRYTRVGALTFSEDITRPVIGLNRHLNKFDLTSSINEQNLPYRTGVTNTDQAIRYVRDSTEFRQDITKVIVVITDGGSRSPEVTAREAALAREQGFYLYVVGVGQYLDEREWRAIASDPDDSFIFNITNFRFLDTVKYTLPSRICLLPPLQIAGSCSVNRQADIFFVAAPGGSQDAASLINNLVRRTQNPSNIRATYLLSNCETSDVPLREVETYCESLDFTSPVSGETYTSLLLTLRTNARQQRENTGSYGQVAVLFFDEESYRLNRNAINSAARDLQDFDGIELIVVDLGVRSGLSNLLQSIVKDRSNFIRFAPGRVDEQRQDQRLLLERTCEAVNRESNIDVPPV